VGRDPDLDPNAPEAVLLSADKGVTVLAVARHHDDEDDRCFVFRWEGTRWASSSMPNDEARSGHPLWKKGLGSLLWGGIVQRSELTRELERQNRIHPRHDASRFAGLTHYIVLTKELTIEVAAEMLTIERREGSTLEAAVASADR
jgi:hypothetical protein